jgi:hypothetical protein
MWCQPKRVALPPLAQGSLPLFKEALHFLTEYATAASNLLNF